MEGIRRIGILFRIIAALWLGGFLIAATGSAIGHDEPMDADEQRIAYEQTTGKSLQKEIDAIAPPLPASADMLQTIQYSAPAEAQQKILAAFFSNHPSTIRHRDWGEALTHLISGAIGAAIFGALGWVISGFAIRRP